MPPCDIIVAIIYHLLLAVSILVLMDAALRPYEVYLIVVLVQEFQSLF